MSEWFLSKQVRFEASHRLMYHDGKCARLHGHSWVATVACKGYGLRGDGPKQNMVIDYGDLSAALKPLVEEFLDHHHLNETLDSDMPTSEFIAEWLFGKLRPILPQLCSVVIEETCTSRCEYRP